MHRDPKVLIALKSCHRYAARREAQQATWLQNLDWAEYFYVIGKPTPADGSFVKNALICEVSDAFENIAPKIVCACEYALEENAAHLFIGDDDTYVQPTRLLHSGFEKHDYVGFLRVGPLGYNGDVPYAQGSAQWLSARAMEYIVKSPLMAEEGVIDDGAIGRTLIDKVAFVHDWRYEPGPFWYNRTPRPENNIITTHKCLPEDMLRAHDPWRKR